MFSFPDMKVTRKKLFGTASKNLCLLSNSAVAFVDIFRNIDRSLLIDCSSVEDYYRNTVPVSSSSNTCIFLQFMVMIMNLSEELCLKIGSPYSKKGCIYDCKMGNITLNNIT